MRITRNNKLIFFSIIAGLALIIAVEIQPCTVNAFGCLDVLGIILAGVILLPIIFGIIGFASASENKLKQGFLWLVVSFAIIFTLNLIAGQFRKLSNDQGGSPTTEEIAPIPKNLK